MRVSAELRSLGFEIGQCVGNSLSITAAARLFESCFHVKLQEGDGGVQFAGEGYELAAEKIPLSLRAQIVTVTFMPPPDFGPGTASSFM